MSSRHDYVDYKGVRVDFQHGTAREYDAFMSDDNASDFHDQEAKDDAMERAKKEYERRQSNAAHRDRNSAGIEENRKNIGKGGSNEEEKKGPHHIDSPGYSPEITAAQKIVNDYQSGLKDRKSPWEQAQQMANESSFGVQNQTDFTSQYNPSGQQDQKIPVPTEEAQSFADKYKLDLISTGATKGTNQ